MGNINSREYWNYRFDRDWITMQGEEQTEFFARIALELMPSWFRRRVADDRLTVCDFGCAMGQAVDYLARELKTEVSGADFSENAVREAGIRYPKHEFFCMDITEPDVCNKIFDVGYISNVLEHIDQPWETARNILSCIRQYFLIMVPFRETMFVEEHCNKFDIDRIPIRLENFLLVHVEYRDCALMEGTLYADKQILLLYAREDLKVKEIMLKEYVDTFERKYLKEIAMLHVERADLQEQIAGNGKSCSEMATKIQILCEQVDILNGQLDQEKQNRSLCELERQADAQRMEETENRNREYAESNANLEARNANLEARNANLEACNANLEACNVNLEACNAELETKRTELEAGNSELRIKYAEAETRNARLELRCMKAKYRSAELEVRCGELEANNSELTEKLDYAKRQDAWCKSAIYDLQMEIKRYQNSLSWRITLPLRMVRRGILAVVRGERKLIGNMVVRFRNSKGYPVLKRYIPHAVKKKLEEKYFSGQQSELLIRNSSQENDVLKIVHEFDKATGQGDKLLLVFSGVKYVDDEGQRNIRLIHEARKMGVKVVFAYWRWNHDEKIDEPGADMIQIPIDILASQKIYFFESYFRDVADKTLLVEFPHPYAAQIVEIASSFGWKTAYDVIDDWEEFSKCGQAEWYRIEVERKIANSVDLNVATAYVLRDKLKQNVVEGRNYPVVTNGVDPNRMRRCGRMPEYDHTRGTLQVGYFGHLTDAWFDWELLRNLAAMHPEWTFHMIGYGAPDNIRVPENIILYGRKSPEELPRYAAFWDVAIIPFINNHLTKGVNPIKVFEYLQLRLPVVASEMPEIASYPYVTLAVGTEAFERAILSAVGTKMDEKRVEEFIKQNTWKRKCEELLNHIAKIEKAY